MAKKTNEIAETPLMRQYNSIKSKYPDAILLYRVGDFYETFSSDAVIASQVLDIVLTKRANGAAASIELAGFPHHALDTYLPKLVRAGYRVAICDQLEDPKTTKTIVKRGVTELVTPGVSYNDKILDKKENNFLASIHLNQEHSGIAFLDISTGEFLIAEGGNDYIDKLLQTFKPTEIIVQKNKKSDFVNQFGGQYYINTFDDWVFTSEFTHDILLKHFETTSLKGFGVEELRQGTIAAGAALHYLAETHHDQVSHINALSRIEEDDYIWMDRFTIRNLELVSSQQEATTLLKVIDQTVSPMGSRLIRRWLLMPLKNPAKIELRTDAVAYFKANPTVLMDVRAKLKSAGDLERLVSKAAVGRITPRELLQLKIALGLLQPVKKMCAESNTAYLVEMGDRINLCLHILERLTTEIADDAPALLAKGNVIAAGVSPELDELRDLSRSGKDYLIRLQQNEAQKTGISSLRVGFNNVFGYYLEVTNTHKDKVPETWIRKQTLVNSERYITEELKEYEDKILHAEERIMALESDLYNELVLSLSEYTEAIQLNAAILATVDCLAGLAKLASDNNYVRAGISGDFTIDIKKGRHPVIETLMKPGEKYVDNDVYLDDVSQQIIILTGPNMSGKSALLRQTALIVLMAQMGSFVPAGEAHIGVVDKIFTRVGASDNISSGESTFMVEMNETSSILNNLSNRCLIILDEIGRGTSTYDGISIAWAITEFLHEHPLFKPKVMFATHYHELNEMAGSFERIKNYHISVKEIGNKILFLRKLTPGGSEHSFGIHVARMAGMPKIVLERSTSILKSLETAHQREQIGGSGTGKKKTRPADDYQLSFIQLNDPLLEQIRDDIIHTDIDNLTPVEALMKLNTIKKLLKK